MPGQLKCPILDKLTIEKERKIQVSKWGTPKNIF